MGALGGFDHYCGLAEISIPKAKYMIYEVSWVVK